MRKFAHLFLVRISQYPTSIEDNEGSGGYDGGTYGIVHGIDNYARNDEYKGAYGRYISGHEYPDPR